MMKKICRMKNDGKCMKSIVRMVLPGKVDVFKILDKSNAPLIIP